MHAWCHGSAFLNTDPLWGESPVDSHHKGPVMRSYDVFSVVCLKKINKQSNWLWFETRYHCNEIPCFAAEAPAELRKNGGDFIWITFHFNKCASAAQIIVIDVLIMLKSSHENAELLRSSLRSPDKSNIWLELRSNAGPVTITHWGRVTHICVSKLGHHCFRWWLVVCSVSSHHLNQCSNIVNWTLRNKLLWNLNRNSCIFTQENASENVVWKMAAMMSRPQCDNWWLIILLSPPHESCNTLRWTQRSHNHVARKLRPEKGALHIDTETGVKRTGNGLSLDYRHPFY